MNKLTLTCLLLACAAPGAFGQNYPTKAVRIVVPFAPGAAFNIPDAKEKMAVQGLFVVASPPEQFAEYEKQEIVRWTKVVRDSGVKPQ